MVKYRILIPLATIFFLLFVNSKMQAQIQPPLFLCVDNDTLVWEPPVNNCGSFQGYIIQGSQNEGGPYNPVDTITDPMQNSFFHEEAAGTVWYYYLESDYDCPGFNRIPSDTLDNRIPGLAPLLSASVEGEEVVLKWTPSPSPETFAYIVRRNTTAGTVTIDTVYSETTYTDTNAAPEAQVETYFITALDQCGNTSLVSAPHSTMLLEAGEVIECDQTISFSWSPYVGWDNGPERYEIWVFQNGSSPIFEGQVDGNTTRYTFEDADDGQEYCFIIRAVETEGGNEANSNVICQTVSVVQPIRELIIDNITFKENSEGVEIGWRWNANAALAEAVLLRSVDNGPFAPINNISLSNPLTANNAIEDLDLPADAGSVCYRVETIDDCGDPAVSNIACTIHLTAVSDGQGGNRLNWTPLELGSANILNYEIFRVQSGLPSLVETLDQSANSFDDEASPDANPSGVICYYVVAQAETTTTSGGFDRIASRSNIACTELSSAIYIPNAFAPEGLNTEFRAYLQFGNPSEYLLQIYDRWGNQVFQAQSIEQAWDGTSNGRDMPSGVYIYRLTMTQANGNLIERSGTVNLVR